MKNPADTFFVGLLESTHKPMMGLAMGITGDRQSAEDACQEAYLELHRALRAAKPISNHSGWLRTVVLRKAIEQAEQRAKRPLSRTSAALAGLAQPGNGESSALEDRMDLEDALARLPAEQRIAFGLKFLHGLSYREIAAVLQCSLDTVCTRIRKAHRTLHERLGGSQSDDPRPPEA